MNPLDAAALLWARNEQVSSGLILSEPQVRMNTDFEANMDPLYIPDVSRQVGKTYWALAKADEIARANPGCQIRVATAFKEDIKTIVVPNFRNVLSTCPEALKPKYMSGGVYQYPGDSEIHLVGLDVNPDKMRGNRLRLVVVEEAGFVDPDVLRYVFESVISFAQLREANARTIMPSTPPEEGQEHYWCELADQCQLKGSYTKIDIDHANFTPEAITKLEKMLGGRGSIPFRREALCERIVDTTKTIIPEWDEHRHIVDYERPPYFKYLLKFCFLDSGVRDKTVGSCGYYDFPKARLIVEDEFVLQGPEVTTRAIYQNFARLESALQYEKPLRFSDNDNIILLQDLDVDHGMHFIPTSKDTLPAMVNNLRLWVKDDRVLLNPKCQLTARTMRSGLWDKDRKEFKRTVALGHCDALAQLMYGVRNVELNSYTNPIPSFFGKDVENSVFGKTAKASTSGQVLADAFGLRRSRQ